MEKISIAIRCANCRLTLTSPVFLPCFHSICKYHTQTNFLTHVTCGECGKIHPIPNEGFAANESLTAIIASQIHNIELGEAHKKAKTHCKSLEELINEINTILVDPNRKTNEEIDRMKNQVYLKRELLKLEIDDETNKLIEQLEDYVKISRTHLNNEAQTNLDSVSRVAKSTLDEYNSQLDVISLD